MNKVYLLLRNNHQTGPHSLEELIQLGLKPLDLVWIEGKSFSWSYPSEISALKPYVAKSGEALSDDAVVKEPPVASETSSSIIHQAYMPHDKETPSQSTPAPAKKIYVSMPAKVTQQPVPEPQEPAAISLEQKADELRRRTQAYASANKPVQATNKPAAVDAKPATPPVKPAAADAKPPAADAVQVKYTRPVGELEEEYSSWIYNQKSKKKKNFSWGGIAAAVAVVLLLGAAFGISKYDSSENETVNQVEPVTQELPEKDIAANEALIPPPVEQESSTRQAPHTQSISEEKTASTPVKPEKKDNMSFASPTTPPPADKKEVKMPVKPVGVKGSSVPTSTPVDKERETSAVPVENSSKVVVAKPKEETVGTSAETPAKKKTFGSAIGGFFNKFKRKVDVLQEPEEQPAQENSSGKQPVEKPQNTMQEPSNERKAQRRGEEAGKTEVPASTAPRVKTNFEDLVDINSNEPAEKWMLGVHGLKLTIHNRSKETLRTAAVEVKYYSEQNELLEKKVVNFSNVPPSKSMTLPVPDHRLADHTEYRFISASN